MGGRPAGSVPNHPCASAPGVPETCWFKVPRGSWYRHPSEEPLRPTGAVSRRRACGRCLFGGCSPSPPCARTGWSCNDRLFRGSPNDGCTNGKTLQPTAQDFNATGFTCNHECGNPRIRVASFHIVRWQAYLHLLHCLLRCFRKCRANPGGSCLNVQATDAAGFRLFSGQVPAKCETAEARVFTSSLLALRFRTACRDRRCAMPALISSSPQPSAIRQMCVRQLRVEATLSAMSSRQ